ncbi:hypothetical protein EDB89DRAFT_66709 [Lactarius sanguifluus]|nr:hypothetical protein EDB89DRAFT_66709 [Lactarius sanguifluus]
MISEIWQDAGDFWKPPTSVYYTFWGKDLNKLLQLVPECGDFRYLTKEQIHKLGVRGPLGYREVVLLVRKEYEDAYSELRSYQSIPEESRGGGVVVLGQPGIGKTCFLYYLLFRLLSEEKTVAFQRGDIFVLFTETGVQICGSTGLDAAIIPHGTWALADSHTGFERPCEAFLDASGAGTAWVVQTASPSKSNYERWQKEQDARLFWMQVVPFDELNALGKILGLNAERLRKNYNLWGPSVRVCISLTKNPDDVGSYAQSVADAADSLTSQYDDFKSTSTRELFVVRPTSSSRQMVTEEFGTNHLRGIVARAYAKHDHATRLTFYKAIRRLSLFSSPAGQMYEINVLLWFRHARDTDFLRCTSNTTGSPQLEIPACPGNLKFFSQPNELHEMYEPGRPICWVPTSGTLPTLDAVVLTDDSVVTVQITVASKHSANNLAFEDVYRNLPPSLKAKPRCHVFISDSGLQCEIVAKAGPDDSGGNSRLLCDCRRRGIGF